MSLRTILSNYGFVFQRELFPALEEELGPLGERYELFITVLGFVQVEQFLTCLRGLPGRPQEDRTALARAFIAKAVFAITTTRALIERLAIDPSLRRLCGWSRAGEVPGEATFSRAFSTFADSALPSRLHEALIDKTLRDHLVGHVSRDSTAIEGREKAAPKSKQSATPKRRRGRPRKGEQRPKASRRLERQLRMTLSEMLDDLPRASDVGVKQGAKGHRESWSGYKLHIDAADGGIALSCILTSASLHDSQAAIPLLMDSAYDAPEIRAHSASLGHVAVIDANPRSAARKRQLAAEAKAQRCLGQVSCEQVRYRERSTVERVKGRLKDDFGGRQVRVRGHAKVLSPEVRHSCADGGAVGTAAGLKPTWFHPAVAGAALSRRGCTGEVWPCTDQEASSLPNCDRGEAPQVPRWRIRAKNSN